MGAVESRERCGAEVVGAGKEDSQWRHIRRRVFSVRIFEEGEYGGGGKPWA